MWAVAVDRQVRSAAAEEDEIADDSGRGDGDGEGDPLLLLLVLKDLLEVPLAVVHRAQGLARVHVDARDGRLDVARAHGAPRGGLLGELA